MYVCYVCDVSVYFFTCGYMCMWVKKNVITLLNIFCLLRKKIIFYPANPELRTKRETHETQFLLYWKWVTYLKRLERIVGRLIHIHKSLNVAWHKINEMWTISTVHNFMRKQACLLPGLYFNLPSIPSAPFSIYSSAWLVSARIPKQVHAFLLLFLHTPFPPASKNRWGPSINW